MITTCLTGNIGNHMWYYSICRIVADKLGYEWGINPIATHDYHSGMNQMYFMNIDFGKKVNQIGKDSNGLPLYEGIINYYSDIPKAHVYNGDSCLINMYDDNVFNISDNTRVHLISQSEDYLIERRQDVINWFSINKEYEKSYIDRMDEMGIILDENTCVINFRGGEYKSVINLIPAKSYWDNSISYMRLLNPNMKFLIITDDTNTASLYMPGIPSYHVDIGFDFYIVNKSKYLIIANSSFSWWAAWLNINSNLTIAPKYFGRYNVSNGYWSLGDSYSKQFSYMDRNGILTEYDLCKKEALEFYKNNNLI